MKSIRKDTVIKHESIESLEVEKMILLKVKHPFIISMDYVFVLETRVYFIMQYIKGGDMGMQLSEQIRIKESRVKFYIA
jgi:serine/threonine protein kinase